MATREERKRKLKESSDRAATETDALLEDELTALKRITSYDLSALRPKVSDPAAFDKMIAIVQEVNQKNMNVAELKSKLEAAGQDVVKIAKEVFRIIK